MKNFSKQREAITEYLKSTDSHPTADEVYDRVRITYPNISLGTVYRNLNQLSENGIIRKVCTLNGPDHFDYRTDSHGHFTCRLCGRIYDVTMDMTWLSEDKNILPGVAESCDVMYHGVCTCCSKKAAYK
ncbi:MAG: transcriptional repressor [Eubacteriales bacterium]|nr:transcriptional repressor [Eubacteriales bacterium]